MYILVKEFNFKITHSDKSDINKLKRLLNRKEFNEIRDVLYKEISANDTVIQCSNFKNFPPKYHLNRLYKILNNYNLNIDLLFIY